MLKNIETSSFDNIYNADLVYVSDCWKLCGDAHCCGFLRYKNRFNILAQKDFHELPLLPGEYEYLQQQGWWSQFENAEHRVIEYPIDHRVIKLETMVSHRKDCACNHDTRLTVCRLYPQLPVFEMHGKLVDVNTFGIFEEFEKLENLEPGCKINSIPFDQIKHFLTITNEIAKSPINLFYFIAYQLVINHVTKQIKNQKEQGKGDSFSIFEGLMVLGKLVDHNTLKPQLVELANQFEQHYGECFSLTEAT